MTVQMHCTHLTLADPSTSDPPLSPTVLSTRRWVDCLFNARALPLQALSLLILPMFWTIPRLLAIQLSVPIAVSQGERWAALYLVAFGAVFEMQPLTGQGKSISAPMPPIQAWRAKLRWTAPGN